MSKLQPAQKIAMHNNVTLGENIKETLFRVDEETTLHGETVDPQGSPYYLFVESNTSYYLIHLGNRDNGFDATDTPLENGDVVNVSKKQAIDWAEKAGIADSEFMSEFIEELN